MLRLTIGIKGKNYEKYYIRTQKSIEALGAIISRYTRQIERKEKYILMKLPRSMTENEFRVL